VGIAPRRRARWAGAWAARAVARHPRAADRRSRRPPVADEGGIDADRGDRGRGMFTDA
jgi:hypothetical protein